jgi:pilus assembly protein CpaC
MHRTVQGPRALLAGAWLLSVLALAGGGARAQEVRKGPVFVPIGGSVTVQMSSKKDIKDVENKNEKVVEVRPEPGRPNTIRLLGLAPGRALLDLTAADNTKETIEVLVQLDIEFLRSQIRLVTPTASVTPVPTSATSVVLTGTVLRAEDIDIIMRVVAGMGLLPVNAMHVGGVQQVQLDVVVAQVSRQQFRRMAFDFLYDARNFFLGSTVGSAVINPISTGVGGQFSVFPALVGNPGVPNGLPTNVLFGVIRNNWGFLGFLQALKEEDILKLMAQPSVVTMSGRPASMLAGGEQAIPVPAGLGQVGVQFEEFGTRLNFLPIVLGNGRIHLEVEPEVSALDPASGTTIQGTVVPGRLVNRVNTTVELEDGQTFVIGGLIQHSVLASVEKVPLVGELPFFGAFFSRKSYQENEQEVVLLVTVHLVDAQDCSQVPKLLPGQETRSPDDFELFLEGILEAPRGPRQVCCPNYVPAYKNGPSASQYPCAGNGDGHGGCGNGACGNGGCGNGGVVGQGHVAAPAPAAAPQAAQVPTTQWSQPPADATPTLAPTPPASQQPLPPPEGMPAPAEAETTPPRP